MHAILFKLNFPIPRFLNNADEAVPACADQAMGAGMDELLQYYERELGTLHAHNQAFARRYPAIAGALGIVGSDLGTTDDPHLARMLQAFAMFNARTAKRLADGFGTFSETLLEVNFPHYLRPFPACAIARIDNDLAAVSELAVIPRGTLMHAAEHQGVACKFTTAYDVAVAPLRLSEVRFQSIVAAPPAVRLPPDLGGSDQHHARSDGRHVHAGRAAAAGAAPVPRRRAFLLRHLARQPVPACALYLCGSRWRMACAGRSALASGRLCRRGCLDAGHGRLASRLPLAGRMVCLSR